MRTPFPRRAAALSAAVAVAAPALFAPSALAGGAPTQPTPEAPKAPSVDAPESGTPGTGIERPEVVAHRGASGYRPEHTLAAYELAVEQGADVIEPDLVSTKDGVLVDRHENDITGTTDVAERPEFADRKKTKVVDGVEQTGWFTEDFTLDELLTLRAKERLPEVRGESASYDGMYQVPTFAAVLMLRERLSEETGREIGIIPEIKHSTYFDEQGLSMEEKAVAQLEVMGLNTEDSVATVQSFELENLRELNHELGLKAPTVFLSWYEGFPYDSTAAGDEARDYAWYETEAGMREIKAAGVDVLGPELSQIIEKTEDGAVGAETSFVDDAHRLGLEVVPYTFRAENQFLYSDFQSSEDPNEHGDMAGQIRLFLDAGIDGLFTDQPDLGVEAVDGWVEDQNRGR